jgi:hypothetical protein
MASFGYPKHKQKKIKNLHDNNLKLKFYFQSKLILIP